MSRIIKLAAVLGALAGLVTVFTPAFWVLDHSQALANVLIGQFAAIAIGHTAYRITSGKRPSLRSAVAGVVSGIGIAVSPIVFGLVTGFTTVTMACGGLVVAVGLYGVVANLRTEEEQRIPDLQTEGTPDDGVNAA